MEDAQHTVGKRYFTHILKATKHQPYKSIDKVLMPVYRGVYL